MPTQVCRPPEIRAQGGSARLTCSAGTGPAPAEGAGRLRLCVVASSRKLAGPRDRGDVSGA